MKILSVSLIILSLLVSSCSSDDGNEVVITPLVGIGTITFEDDGNKVIEEYGTYKEISVSHMGPITAFWLIYDNGLQVQLNPIPTGNISLQQAINRSSSLIDLDQRIIQMTIIPPFTAMTREGIKLGSDKADVVEVFGNPEKLGDIADVYQELAMRIWYNSSDKVKQIDILGRR